MALFQGKTKITHIPTLAQQVYDVTGAGDTVIGTLGLSPAAGIPLPESCILADCAAGIVVGKSGSATTNQQEMEAVLQTLANFTEENNRKDRSAISNEFMVIGEAASALLKIS